MKNEFSQPKIKSRTDLNIMKVDINQGRASNKSVCCKWIGLTGLQNMLCKQIGQCKGCVPSFILGASGEIRFIDHIYIYIVRRL